MVNLREVNMGFLVKLVLKLSYKVIFLRILRKGLGQWKWIRDNALGFKVVAEWHPWRDTHTDGIDV